MSIINVNETDRYVNEFAELSTIGLKFLRFGVRIEFTVYPRIIPYQYEILVSL